MRYASKSEIQHCGSSDDLGFSDETIDNDIYINDNLITLLHTIYTESHTDL
jgi:hypothetical protein